MYCLVLCSGSCEPVQEDRTNSLPVRKCKIELTLPSFKRARDCSPFPGIFAFFLSSVKIPGMAFRALESFSPLSVLVLQAKLDSRSSQLDDFLYFKRFGLFEYYMLNKFFICIVCETNDHFADLPTSPDLLYHCLEPPSLFCFPLIPSLSPHHTSQPSWRFTAHSFLRPGIDNLIASVKAIYSAKLTRTSKTVTY